MRSETRTYVSKALKAIVDEAPDSEESVKRALKALDTTAKRGVIHRNNADRRKSRLMRRLNAAAANDATA